jgi:hypothetical protein
MDSVQGNPSHNDVGGSERRLELVRAAGLRLPDLLRRAHLGRLCSRGIRLGNQCGRPGRRSEFRPLGLYGQALLSLMSEDCIDAVDDYVAARIKGAGAVTRQVSNAPDDVRSRSCRGRPGRDASGRLPSSDTRGWFRVGPRRGSDRRRATSIISTLRSTDPSRNG